ncbi:hypothetical protein MIND_00571500 [Mycena indigotica]|uniref:DDE-1 domain-containing protein n=1 Tax=Mycena indigotica TaxID=2126181 RepID=A0A8H6W8S1_9AGAR|nr:uncharacterized protein MIND_00571500 [Mycena indigotica]KAF7303429.1 hypothetical protein MIND_00571500 [Mycena indigotica]
MPTRLRKRYLRNAAAARAKRHPQTHEPDAIDILADSGSELGAETDDEITTWRGGLSYLRSNKWATDPAKLSEFVRTQFVSPEAKEFLCHVVEDEIPKALGKYVTTTLFPRIGVKAGLGHSILLSMAREWMAKFGWKYQEHKKALYYDGHECPDVLKEKIIPAFENEHGPGYQALFLIDNSQGHSAYSVDALLAQRMNLNSGRKQAHLRSGWYLNSHGQRIEQPMIFLANHPDPALPKPAQGNACRSAGTGAVALRLAS